MGKVFITDYISDPYIERSMLKEHITDDINDKE